VARVLVVCSEPIGAQMAGPAIRARELAHQLAAQHDVTVAAPAPSDVGDPRIRLVEAGFVDYDALTAAVEAADVVVAQLLPPRLLAKLPRLGTRLVADLYNPTVFEVLEAGRVKPPRPRRHQQRAVTLAAVAHLAAADHVVCASEKQRDLWLGVMAGRGLVALDDYEADPSLRSRIDVVPFGLPSLPPVADGLPIRARWPQIGPDDRIVLWGGGVWNWLDPETAIDAVGLLDVARRDGPRTHLVIMGMGRPGIEPVDAMAAIDRMRAHLAQTGLEGEVVHLNDGWVPYDERGAWLLEADVGLSTHHDHLETRFAFRTRVLDYLWARLPVVATRGDTLGDLVSSSGAGLTVPPADAPALAAALDALSVPERHDAAVAAVDALAPQYTWERAAAPLLRFCAGGVPTSGPNARVLREATLASYPSVLAQTHETDGVRGAAERAGRNLRRMLTPGR
jgi:glycosyltransferase involved in cell wall biosynthesis